MATLTLDQQKALALAKARQLAAQAQQSQQAAPAPQPQPQQQAPAPAPEQPQDAGIPGYLGDAVSALNALGDTASFGLAPAAMHGIQNFFSPGSGDETAAKVEAVNQAHPLGVAAGTVASIPVDMMLAAPLAAAAPAVPALNAFVRGGGIVGSGLRTVGFGATTGAINAGTHGGDVGTGAVVGALAGPLGAAVAKPVSLLAEKLITPAATKTWRYLAGKLSEDPDTLVAHISRYIRQTGQQPSLQQIVSDHDAGVIKQFGALHTTAGEIIRSGAQQADNALPAQAQAVVNNARQGLPGTPAMIGNLNPATTTTAEIRNAITDNTTTAMNPIRATVVQLDPDLRDEVVKQLGTGRAVRELRGRLTKGTATVGDLDIVRRRFDKLGGGAIPNPDIQDLASEVESVVGAQVPEYATILGQHAQAKSYADAFEHGASGAERGAATDAGLRAALGSAEGESGYRAGSLFRASQEAGGSPAAASGVLGDIARPGTAQTAFQSTVSPQAAATATEAATALRTAGERARTTAPGALMPQPDNSAAAANIATGIGSLLMGAPISAGRNTGRGLFQAVASMAHSLSPAQQRSVANALTSTNPAIRDFAIQQLRSAGVSDARLKIISGLVAANTARGATSYQGAQ